LLLPSLTSLDTGKKDRLASLALGQQSHRRIENVYRAHRHTARSRITRAAV
jgi:hypothetical protein